MIEVVNMTKMMVSNLHLTTCDDTEYSQDEALDSLVRLQDHVEQEADVDKDRSQLPNYAIPQPSPRTTTNVRHTEDVPSYSVAGLVKNYHPRRSISVPGGMNILQEIDATDPLREDRVKSNNVYYPFPSKAEWELAEWLSSSSIPQSSVNKFLHLDWVRLITSINNYVSLILPQVQRSHPPSFYTAQDMRNRIEHLPEVPKWRHEEIKLRGCTHQTKDPMVLYWRDGLELIKKLFANPAFANSIEYDAYELVDPSTKYRVYGEFMSAQFAWRYQVCALICIAQYSFTNTIICLSLGLHAKGRHDVGCHRRIR